MHFPFNRDGYTHELILQTGSIWLVRRSKGTRQEHWEVVKAQWKQEASFPNGKTTPAHWAYPASEQWGERGWTYNEYEKAIRKYDQLLVTDPDATNQLP
jgi:hypothetical protein